MKTLSWLRTKLPPPRVWIVAIPLWVVLGILAAAVQSQSEFSASDPEPWVALVDKFVLDTLIFFLLLGLCLRISRPIALWLLNPLYLFVYLVNATVYSYGHTRLEYYHLQLLRPESVGAFLNPTTYGMLILFLVLSWLGVRLIRARLEELRQMSLLGPALLIAIVWFASLPKVANYYGRRGYDLKRDEALEYSRIELGNQLSFLRSNDLLRLAKVFRLGPSRMLRTIATSELLNFEGTLQKYGLSLGAKRYPSLGLKPFRKVVLITMESISLDLMSPFNAQLPKTLTPFFGALHSQGLVHEHLFTTATPTLQGLGTIFNSHPNPDLFYGARQFPLSFVERLRKDGFETLHFRGTSRFYGSENLIFKELGFSQIVGLDALAGEMSGPAVGGWGLMDRILFDKVVDRLTAIGPGPAFVHLLTVDPHPPLGREDYSALEYPERRTDLDQFGAAGRLLQTVAFQDLDLEYFVKQLQSRGLWTEDLLLVLTSDHCSPLNSVVRTIPGYPRESLCRVPLVLLSGRTLPRFDVQSVASQLDIAPTLFHLMGREIPEGWWGQSLFAATPSRSAIGSFQGLIYLRDHNGSKVVRISQPESEDRRRLIELFQSVVMD